MFTIIWIGLEFLINCLEFSFLLLVSIFQLDGLHKKIRKWHIIAYILFFSALLLIYNYLTNQSVSSMFWFILVIIVFITFFTKGKRWTKAFWIVFPYSVLFCIERIVIDFVVDINDITLADIAEPNQYRLIVFIIAKSIEAVLLMLSYRYRLEVSREAKFLIIPILCSWLIPTYLILSGKHMWDLTMIFLVLNSCYIIYFIRRSQIDRDKREKEHMELKMQNAFESTVLREYMRQYQGDVNERLKVIWEHMKTNDIPNKGRISDEICQVNLNMQQIYDTGNHLLDITLSMKQAVALEKGIDFKARIGHPLVPSLDYENICNIVIHLADNAIEGTEQIPEEEEADKMILLTMLTNEDFYEIEIENPTNCPPIPPLEVLLSDQNEGHGLKLVKKIVDEYGGTLEAGQSEGYFVAFVRIPIKRSKKVKDRDQD